MTFSLAGRSSSSHVSMSISMRRITTDVPSAIHGVTPTCSAPTPHTTRSRCGVSAAGLPVPSTCPKRLRIVVPVGWAPRAERKPSCTQRSVANGRAALRSMRRAWATDIRSSPQICSSRSPSLNAGSRRSICSNAGSGRSQAGARSGATRRTSSGPKPNVTVSRAGAAASSGSVSAIVARPWVRRAASSVSRRSIRSMRTRSASSRRSRARKTAWAWAGVSTPAWRGPWNGTVSVPTGELTATRAAWPPGSAQPARPTSPSMPVSPMTSEGEAPAPEAADAPGAVEADVWPAP